MKSLKNNLFFSTIAISLFYGLGCVLSLFEKFVWYDEFLHLLAGIWIGILIIWILKKYIYNNELLNNHPKTVILALAIIIGIIWELFEFGLVQYSIHTYNYRPGLQPSWSDAFSDLLMDICGTGIIIWFTKYKNLFDKKTTRNN